jgi:hypothetical protein
MDQASWALVWMQLLGLTVLDIALTWVFNLFPSLAAFAPTTVGGRDPHWLEQLPFSAVLSHPLGQLLLTPVDFFLISGLLYLLARAFGGQGSFLRQNYTQLLVSMPLTLLYGLLALVVGVIPFVSLPLFAVVAFAFFIYGLILQAQALMAVHALSGGKALGVVALTIVAVFLISHVPGGSLLVGF